MIQNPDTELQAAAERIASCPVAFGNHIPTGVIIEGRLVWEGTVSEYVSLKSQHIYAWAVEGETPQYIAALKEPPIKSALDAVRTWLDSARA